MLRPMLESSEQAKAASKEGASGASRLAPTVHATGERVLKLCAAEMARVETFLAEQIDSSVGAIPEVGAHLLDAGGKRLRPLLSVLAARATGAELDLAVSVGCAAELIHTATLFHDDVVDDGRVRRGRPAARLVFGNGIVVLVGDFCLARALETVANTGSLPAVQSLARTVKEMAEGEVAQLEGAGNPEVTADDYFRVIDRKTASLLAWCSSLGGAAPGDLSKPLAQYGRLLGHAFQIADDLLDCVIDETTAGKSVGHDLVEGKLTLPVLLACESEPTLREQIRQALGEKGMTPAAAREILSVVRAAGGVELAQQKAASLARDAVHHLQALAPSPYRDALADLAHFSANRVS